ncbi:MMPL family transporter [Nitrospira sp. NS4]|uniref:MMPL family transporter n=1 Tax=Nitrospira sp. NS4 TaxID=3414498 RepID=UPI003C2F8C2A
MNAARWPILAWLVLMAGALWLTTTRLSVHSELGDLLPEGTSATQRLLLTQVRSGLAGRMLLLAIEGADPDELARLSTALSGQLRGHAQIDFVGNGMQMLSSEEQQLLFRARYLLSRTVAPEAFSTEALHAALEQRLDELRSPLAPMVKAYIPADPTGEFLRILQSWSGWEAPATYRGVWMSADRHRALLVVETTAAGFDVDAQDAIQQDIRAAFQRLLDGAASSARLLMSGPGVFSVEIQRTIEREVWWLSTMAATMVFLFLYASYRSLTLVFLSLIPLSSGILIGMVAVNSWFGFVHGITLGFGITLLGVADDYPIHLFSHLTRRESAPATMRAIWPTMRLGVLTTAIGFSSLLLAGFPALAQLGLFALVGLGTAALVTRWVLPVCIPAGFVPREIRADLLGMLGQLARAKGVVPMAVVLATIGLIWSDTPLWEEDLAKISPVSEERKQLDQELRGAMGAPDMRDLLVIEAPTEEDLLQQSERVMPKLDGLRDAGLLAGYELVSRYVPSRLVQQQRQQALPDRAVLERRLGEAARGLPFAPGLFEPFLAGVETARTQPPVNRDSFQGTPLGLKIGALMMEHHGRWLAVAPLRGVVDRQGLTATVAGWSETAVTYVDLKAESNRLMMEYRDRTVQLLWWGALAITVALGIGLKSLLQLWRVLVPIVAGLIVVVGIVNVSGESMSLFHVATLLLVIGLGLDYALFFNRAEDQGDERRRTVFGLLVCSTTTILVFGALAFSAIPVLHAIGMTAACGSLCCLLFAGFLAEPEAHVA